MISNPAVQASNGHSNLPEFSGSGDGVLGVACTGATPRSGPNIPAQVVTQLRTDLTYLRILHNNGTPLTGTVRINCVLEVESGANLAGSRPSPPASPVPETRPTGRGVEADRRRPRDRPG